MVYSEMKFQDVMEDGDRLDGFRLRICVRRMSDSSEVLESTSRGPTTSTQFTIQAIPGTGTSGELTVTSPQTRGCLFSFLDKYLFAVRVPVWV